jgi:choline kinase
MMSETRTAVVLVAGEGRRLRPFTDANPKCFASVRGQRILENMLAALSEHGCERVRIVVGHFAEMIRDTITERFSGMAIEYINNPDYATTNSMYSLALGLAGLAVPTWVLEGDVFFEHSILAMAACPEIAWFVDSRTPHLDGAYVEYDARGRARSLAIVRDLSLVTPRQAKSIGILKLTRTGVRQIQDWLSRGIAAGQQNLFYDLIIGEHMHEGEVRIVDVAGRKWFEIDTAEDLRQAIRVFS